MTIDTNDPRLTAYALNELEEADRAEIERLLAESPAARAEVEAIRAAAARLSNELAAEPLPDQTPQHAANTPSDNGQLLRLTNEDHQQIEARALAIKLRKWIPSALAASIVLVIAAGLISQGMPDQHVGEVPTPQLPTVIGNTVTLSDGSSATLRTPGTPSESNAAPAQPATSDLATRLAAVIPEFKVEAMPLADVLALFAQLTGIPTTANWNALETVGIEKDTKVALSLVNISANKIMDLLLDEVGAGETYLGSAFVDDGLEVSTLESFADGTRLRAKDHDRLTEIYLDGLQFDDAAKQSWLATLANPSSKKLAWKHKVLSDFASRRRRATATSQPAEIALPKDLLALMKGRELVNAQGGLGGGRFLDGQAGGGGGLFGGGGAGAQARVQISDLEIDAPTATLSRKGCDIFSFDPDSAAGEIEAGVPVFQGRAIRLDGNDPRDGLSASEYRELAALGYVADEVEVDPRPRAGGAAHSIDAARAPSRDQDADWWNRRREGHRHLPENTGEDYARIHDNPFLAALQNPLSTFSIDVDTASYSNIRRMLTANQLPPADAVRIEEMINYFTYDIDGPTGAHPFAVHLETAACPWDAEHRLLRVGLKGRVIEPEKRPACNLVFLIDVSGSMDCANKLPLVKQALAMLAQQLTPADRVAMVVYAGASGVALPSTPAGEKQPILDALDNLQAGGSTNGGEGIELAYDIATQYLNKDGVNRVILCTDGDFNVGITDREKLVKLITTQAKSGVFLSVLGFGMGNLKDATLEQLADKGNGHYAYIDTFAEAKKVLVDEIGSTLVTIAKDVKIQIEFNPAQVAAYRLVGYENRILAARDFNDDKKDAGEIGAGHTVTALYEIVPMTANMQGVDSLKYRKADEVATKDDRTSDDSTSREMLTVKLRYKQPTSDTSTLIEVPLVDSGSTFEGASPDLRFAASVAGFGMMLRSSPHKGDLTYERVISMAVASMGRDPNGQRSEFIDLVRKAKTLSGRE